MLVSAENGRHNTSGCDYTHHLGLCFPPAEAGHTTEMYCRRNVAGNGRKSQFRLRTASIIHFVLRRKIIIVFGVVMFYPNGFPLMQCPADGKVSLYCNGSGVWEKGDDLLNKRLLDSICFETQVILSLSINWDKS